MNTVGKEHLPDRWPANSSTDSVNVVRLHCSRAYTNSISRLKLTSDRYGWGVLIVAGGGAYYFAKKSVNADRAARHEADMKRKHLQQRLELSQTSSKPSPSKPSPSSSQPASSPRTAPLPPEANNYRSSDYAGSPSSEASHDPAPTRHVPETEAQMATEKSKYEATEPYRSRKGDRFS